ncbi:pitrilysin family protein [Streptomyces sp. NPDC020742]|uniref:M16 family metallopeptidase n=1 Tax=Streptomyces sp. NPDC020742 TaxID=3154897 RepID=UPI0033E7E8E4
MHRLTLHNGLRTVLDPRPSALVTEIAVHYHVGYRSEPAGRSGFAHLFEHLMFQGSENVGRSDHHRIVNASGGVANAATHPDYTEYFQAVPPRALERVLFLEADRMRGPRLTEESLRTQIEVIKEEIRLNVTNKPYGGFPWPLLPQVLYREFANAHDGYGHFADLERATVEEAEDFFAAHYAPGNAVLTLTGRFDPERVAALVDRHFGDLPARPGAARPRQAEPAPETDRHGTHHDPFAPLPAVAVGYRLPDPEAEQRAYLAHVLLARLLGHRLRRALVDGTGAAASVRTHCGFFGPFQAHFPDTFGVSVTHRQPHSVEQVLDAVDRELEELAGRGPDPGHLRQAGARANREILRAHDTLLTRVRNAGAYEVLHGRAELVDEFPGLLLTLDSPDISRAAELLAGQHRGVLTLVPGGLR